MKHVLLAALLFGAAPFAAATVAVPITQQYCPLVVYEDYVLAPITYRAVLLRAKTCRLDQVVRLRKTSTMNFGASYQPILPTVGAWELRPTSSTVPPNAYWTLYSWRWQYWDGARWLFARSQ